MRYVYYVYHERKVKKGIFSGKDIGYFSSLKKAKYVVKQYKKLDAFKKYPKGFRIQKIKINKIPKVFVQKKYI